MGNFAKDFQVGTGCITGYINMSTIKAVFISIIIGLIHGVSMNAQRVFMTGDSHVFSKVYPNKIEEILLTQHPDIHFAWWAKNGICFYSFKSNPEYYDSIFAFKPELLIVHLGTNGAYANNYTRKALREDMEQFYSTLTDSLPEVKVVFVTPFTNKKRKNRKKGRWQINYKNGEISEEIKAFVNDHPGTYVIDNNGEAGLMYLKNRNLIRRDNVHLTEAGYEVLGSQVGRHLLEIEEIWK